MTAETIPGTDVPQKATSADMLAVLRRHYIRDESVPAGIFAAEIDAPGGGRRADLVWQGLTRAAGSELVGHEIKVSRADLLVELADLTKSDPWQRYCDHWWLVVPHPALIDGLDLPPSWGVMCPPARARARSVTVVRQAPKLNPDEQAPALRALAARTHWELRDARATVERQRAEAERHYQQVEKLRANADTRALSRDHQIVADIVRELGPTFHDGQIGDLSTGFVDRDAVVAALRDLQSANRARKQVERTRDSALSQLQFLGQQIERTLAGGPR